MITYIHLHIAYWFDEFCGPNIAVQDMVGITLWFVQNTHIFHYMIQIQLRDRQCRCQADPVVVTPTVYMCFYSGMANNLICKSNGILSFFFVQDKNIVLNYGSSNFVMKMDFKKNLSCCNIYKLDYLLELHILLITSTQDDANLCHEIK
jgi:hypothetical protein